MLKACFLRSVRDEIHLEAPTIFLCIGLPKRWPTFPTAHEDQHDERLFPNEWV